MNKLKAFLIGLFFVFIILEIILRISSLFYRVNSPNYNPRANASSYRILCIGDSFTQGVGAKKGYSYPDFLQRILSDKYKDIKFSIINKGRGSYNTAQILFFLDEWLRKIHPQLVIVLAGGANSWNVWGYRRIAKKSIEVAIANVLDRLKVYKLLEHLTFLTKQEYRIPELDSVYYADGGKKSEKVSSLIKRVSGYSQENRCGAALDRLKEAAVDYNSVRLYTWIGMTARDCARYKDALWAFEKGAEIAPRFFEFYAQAAQNAYLSKDSRVREETLRFLNAHRKDMPWVNFYIKKMRNSCHLDKSDNSDDEKIKKWVMHDLSLIINKSLISGAKVILMSYPFLLPYDCWHQVNGWLKEYAQEHDIPFVDNHSMFLHIRFRLADDRKYIERYLAFDHQHPNANGYKIMAENVIEKMKEMGIIKAKHDIR